uniref:Uncharacterized protein n=1 Tax=Hyaloperonospora arabidopsidis (strain Emoy2) TaxID=559515 RepID=M4C3G4_HYAAE
MSAAKGNGSSPVHIVLRDNVPISNLSAKGSKNEPIIDSWWKVLATKPSNQSETPAKASTAKQQPSNPYIKAVNAPS